MSATQAPDQLLLRPFQASPTDQYVVELERLLRERGDWMLRREIEALKGWGEKKIRDLASASDNIISGQLGYKHTEHATIEELDHCSNWIESQGKRMVERAQRLRRRAHQLVG